MLLLVDVSGLDVEHIVLVPVEVDVVPVDPERLQVELD
jgi:hypothetical protein